MPHWQSQVPAATQLPQWHPCQVRRKPLVPGSGTAPDPDPENSCSETNPELKQNMRNHRLGKEHMAAHLPSTMPRLLTQKGVRLMIRCTCFVCSEKGMSEPWVGRIIRLGHGQNKEHSRLGEQDIAQAQLPVGAF